MATIFDLEWENQNGVSSYPFLIDAPLNNIVVDASFIQFENFIPILNYVQVSAASLTFNIIYDTGISNFTLTQSDYNSGLNFIRLFASTRYIGRLVFGPGVNTLWNNYVGQQINFNLPFVSTTVRGISNTCGVFSISGLYGGIEFTRTTLDENIFFNTASNNVTFNAVANNQFPTTPPAQALKLLNLLAPVDNNIFLSSSDVVQISGNSTGSIAVSLVGSNPLSNLAPIANTLGF